MSEYTDGELAGLVLLRLCVKCIFFIYTFDRKHGTSCQEQVWAMCVWEMPNIYFLPPSSLHKHTQLFRAHFHSILGQMLPKSLSTLHLSLWTRSWQITAEKPSPLILLTLFFFKTFSTILLHSSFSKAQLQAGLQVFVLLRTERGAAHTIVSLAGSAGSSPLINL